MPDRRPSTPAPSRPGDGTGDRIAKLLARAGVASRRDVERMIADGRVALNGVAVDTPATLLTSLAGITVDGQPVAAPEPARLFLYHKPVGLLVTERDPRGRPTIYDRLPAELPRVMPVGRLDLATEGLLLLTTDGGFKRQLELPATGVERTYRARAYGDVTQAALEELIHGMEVDGVRYGSIDANIERRTGANLWIELTLTEGKNREVRRVLEHLGLQVSRLIRTRYGPFDLADLTPGEVGEVAARDIVAFRRTLKGGAPDEAFVAATPRPGFRTPPTADRAARTHRAGTGTGDRPEQPRRPAPAKHRGEAGDRGAGRAVADRGARRMRSQSDAGADGLRGATPSRRTPRLADDSRNDPRQAASADRGSKPARHGRRPDDRRGDDASPARRDPTPSHVTRDGASRPARTKGRDDTRADRRDAPPTSPRPPRGDRPSPGRGGKPGRPRGPRR